MSVPTDQPAELATRPALKSILLETAVVALVGAAIAFAANAVSPRGLKLARDYFPRTAPSPAPHPAPAPAIITTNSPAPTVDEAAIARLKARGLQVIETAKVAELFRDARRAQGLILFVDARDDDHFSAGHIPDAMQFDYYHPEKNLGDVLVACQRAELVVVYCNGGDCEDSEFATMMLRDGGVANTKLFVFAGGIKAWSDDKQPVETGARSSGIFKKEAR